MAVSNTKSRTDHASCTNSKRTTHSTAFLLVSLLLSLFTLFGCGGGVSTSGDTPGQSPAPSTPATGAATLTWVAPTTYVNGTPLTTLAGYKIYYGTTPGAYRSIDVGNVNSFHVTGLSNGQTYYFTVTDYDTNGVESDYSTVVSKLII